MRTCEDAETGPLGEFSDEAPICERKCRRYFSTELLAINSLSLQLLYAMNYQLLKTE